MNCKYYSVKYFWKCYTPFRSEGQKLRKNLVRNFFIHKYLRLGGQLNPSRRSRVVYTKVSKTWSVEEEEYVTSEILFFFFISMFRMNYHSRLNLTSSSLLLLLFLQLFLPRTWIPFFLLNFSAIFNFAEVKHPRVLPTVSSVPLAQQEFNSSKGLALKDLPRVLSLYFRVTPTTPNDLRYANQLVIEIFLKDERKSWQDTVNSFSKDVSLK